MFDKQVIPVGEKEMHINFLHCKCQPVIKIRDDTQWLWHNSFDHREIWLGVEILLGMVCMEHHLFVDQEEYGQTFSDTHEHLPRPEPHFEYTHKKIDPR